MINVMIIVLHNANDMTFAFHFNEKQLKETYHYTILDPKNNNYVHSQFFLNNLVILLNIYLISILRYN